MDSRFKAISLSYKNAPVEVRELIALDDNATKDLLRYFKEYSKLSDVLILSTCNRTEVYYSSQEDLSQEIVKLLGIHKNVQSVDELASYFDNYTAPNSAIKHLFEVATGLDAQVVGDMQIANQVKNAYQLSADLEVAGPFLHRLLHTVFYTNKRVVQETAFKDGAASVSYAAAEMVDDFAQKMIDPKVLVIGLGEIGEDVCKNLVNANLNDITICNRTNAKAAEIASECGFKTTHFKEVKRAIIEADIIISSINQDKPLITKSLFTKKEVLSYKYIIDLSVPRSVDPDLENVPGILVYNIDMIKAKTTDALRKRLGAIPDVEEIISESLVEFQDWSKEMEVSPTINKLKDALEKIRQEELARYLKNLDQDESKRIDQITRSMMQKVIKLPVLQLKAACKRGEAETLIDVLNDLFDLEKKPKKA